ncbi:MAG: asparagine synthase (glutamine-hydrolyzing) [Trichloromonadaceae bacterium]
MCGIVGFVSNSVDEPAKIIANMATALIHRGPDIGDCWADHDAGVSLGHRRLSILDLSEEGHQPMFSGCGRYVIIYNGEIYNFQDIKAELQCANHQSLYFRGHSDTEVLLAAISIWGLEQTLPRINGMFAFALWDRREKCLTLVRDRFGKKPLYFGWAGGNFVFGSELKAIKVFPGFSNVIDRHALTLLLRHNCIPAPYSIYQYIYKLPPATSLELSIDKVKKATCYEDVASDIKSFWSPRQVCEAGQANRFAGSAEEVEGQLEFLLKDAVASRMIADVPLGAFLSGGIDSSLVVALMQAQSERPVKTFTIGFAEAAHNEADDARRVAQHLGTEHHELTLSPQDVLDVVPKLPVLYDEPFADSSQIPTYLVSKFAREHVTVALSGDGGDELFGGYNRYVWAPQIWNKMASWPAVARGGAAALLDAVPPKAWPRLMSMLNLEHRTPADKVLKLAQALRASAPADLYKSLVSHWHHPDDIVIDGREPQSLQKDADRIIQQFGFAEGMMLLDQVTYLPDDILVKVDRASMGVSLEARAPLLDYRLAEFAARVPLDLKIRERQGKYLLRKILYRHVPRELIERPKMGFEIPIADWLRGPLRDWAEDLLSESRLKNDGYFHPGPIRLKWQEHLAGKRNWQFHLWDVLMFQMWLKENL